MSYDFFIIGAGPFLFAGTRPVIRGQWRAKKDFRKVAAGFRKSCEKKGV